MAGVAEAAKREFRAEINGDDGKHARQQIRCVVERKEHFPHESREAPLSPEYTAVSFSLHDRYIASTLCLYNQ